MPGGAGGPCFSAESGPASGGCVDVRACSVGAASVGLELDAVRCVRVVEVGTDDVDGLVLEARAAISLVVRPSGREASGAGVRVLTPEGLVVESRVLDPHAPSRIDLAPGSYDVETWTERDGARQRTPIEVVRELVVVDVR